MREYKHHRATYGRTCLAHEHVLLLPHAKPLAALHAELSLSSQGSVRSVRREEKSKSVRQRYLTWFRSRHSEKVRRYYRGNGAQESTELHENSFLVQLEVIWTRTTLPNLQKFSCSFSYKSSKKAVCSRRSSWRYIYSECHMNNFARNHLYCLRPPRPLAYFARLPVEQLQLSLCENC